MSEPLVKVVEHFGLVPPIAEGGWLFGGSVTEASMWVEGDEIHVFRVLPPCSVFVEKQIAETVEALTLRKSQQLADWRKVY